MSDTKKSNQPSFDDIMAAAAAPKPEARPAPQIEKAEPKPENKAAAQPSFEEIMAGASQPPPAPGQPPRAREERKGGKPPRKDERKWPVVVRKIALPKPGEAAQVESLSLIHI